MNKLTVYPATLIRVYDGIQLEWRYIGEDKYQAYFIEGDRYCNQRQYKSTLLNVDNFGSYDWLMTLEEVVGKWRGTVFTFEVNSFWHEGRKIEQQYYANYCFDDRALELAKEFILREFPEALLKRVEVINPSKSEMESVLKKQWMALAVPKVTEK